MAHLLAYADSWSAAPGETVRFFVSCNNESTYRAQLFRLVQPDAGPNATPFEPQRVDAPLNRSFRGRLQTLPIGSFAVVPNFSSFEALEQFAFIAIIFPTTPKKGRQSLFGTWCEHEQRGVGLEIGVDGALNLRIGTHHGSPIVLSTGIPLKSHRWYRIAAVLAANEIELSQEPLHSHGFCTEKPACISAPRPKIAHAEQKVLSMAGWCAGKTSSPSAWNGCQFECYFNGRIENPRIAIGALDKSRIAECSERAGEPNGEQLFAAWDFGQEMSTETIRDIGPYGLHGHLINLPTRGVTGHNWSGEIFNWRHAPHEYRAIHFHDDDLSDARWSVDFEYRIPEGARSGIYAVWLSAGQEEAWIPFVIRPLQNRTASDVVLLLPTMTYLAYLNHRARFMSLASERIHGRLKILDATDISLIETPGIGLSTYDCHSDGSGVTYSSRLRPALNMRPTGHLYHFSLDLFIVDWLERLGLSYDVITDEDLHNEGIDILRPYKVVITGSHPEYASKDMLDTLERFLREGGRLMYMGGNGFYFRTVWHPKRNGLIEVRRSDGVRAWDASPGELATSFCGENSGTWRNSGRAPQRLVGVGYVAQGFNRCSHYTRTAAADDPRISWAFEGVCGKVLGNESVLLGGAAGLELDSINLALGTPEHALVIARSENHSIAYELASEEVLTPHGATDGLSNDAVHADMVFFETPGGGAAFSAGSIAYSAALTWNDFDNDLCRLTTNVLKRFRQNIPFAMPQSPPC